MSEQKPYDEILDSMLESPNPIIRYKSHVNILGTDVNEQSVLEIREQIRTSAVATSLLADLSEANPETCDGMNTLYGRLQTHGTNSAASRNSRTHT